MGPPCLPLQHPCAICSFITIVPIGGWRMCDFTHSCVASTAEHSHVYGQTWREGSSNTLIYSTSDTVCHLSLSLTLSQTHIPQRTVSPPPMVPPLHSTPIRAHLAITSAALPPQRNQFRPAPNRHGMLAKGDGVLSGSWLQPPFFPPPLLLPPRCFSTFPQHAWCISRVARQHDRTAPENLLELFCTLCDLLKFLQNCACVFCDSALSLPLHGYTVRFVKVSETNEACIMCLNRVIVRFVSNRLSLMAKSNTHHPPIAS